MPKSTALRVYHRRTPTRSFAPRPRTPLSGGSHRTALGPLIVPIVISVAADLVALYFAVQLLKAFVKLLCLLVVFQLWAALAAAAAPRD